MDPSSLIIAFLLVLLAVVTVYKSVVMVDQGFVCTVTRFGRYVRSLDPGLSLIIPFFDRVDHRVSVMETVTRMPDQEVITRDNVSVTVDAVVFYQVLDAAKSVYKVADLRSAILNLVMTNTRTAMGSMDLDELLSKRDEINVKLLSVIDNATEPWGTKVTRVEIMDIKPPQDLIDSMSQQMRAERMKRATVLEADGDRQSAILRAEGDKSVAILEAEGRKEAAFRNAEARERESSAEAYATKAVSEAISSGSPAAINYFVAQKYVDALGKIASSPNQKLIMMPLEASSLIGSVAGMAEIAKDAFQGDGRVLGSLMKKGK